MVKENNMSWLSKLFSDTAGDLIDKVGDTADKFIMTPEEKEKFKAELLRLKTDGIAKLSELEVKDRDSARNREIEITRLTKNFTQNAMAWASVVGFFAVMYMVFTKTIPEGAAKDILLVLLGALTKIVSDIYGYYFGSSKGSADKNELINKLSGE